MLYVIIIWDLLCNKNSVSRRYRLAWAAIWVKHFKTLYLLTNVSVWAWNLNTHRVHYPCRASSDEGLQSDAKLRNTNGLYLDNLPMALAHDTDLQYRTNLSERAARENPIQIALAPLPAVPFCNIFGRSNVRGRICLPCRYCPSGSRWARGSIPLNSIRYCTMAELLR